MSERMEGVIITREVAKDRLLFPPCEGMGPRFVPSLPLYYARGGANEFEGPHADSLMI